MGNQTAGSDKLRALPVWYYNGKNTTDFNDWSYASFGGWKQPAMKEYDRERIVFCNTYIYGYEYY